MENKVVLKQRSIDGQELEATFLPEKGMNMISYKKGGIEIIDPSTQPMFEERFAGLGAFIGPHFHRRNPAILPLIEDEGRFPHIARVKAKGIQDPFSHGIGRYAPWQFQVSDGTLNATLSGKDEWNGIPLAKLEGQNFKLCYVAALKPRGLQIKLSVVSDTDSILGLHFYYLLPQGKGKVVSDIQESYLENGEAKPIPDHWKVDDQKRLHFDLREEADYTFHPFVDHCSGSIILETSLYRLHTRYRAPCEENGWQLYHPKDASFVCIEPLSAFNPKKPCLTASMLEIDLEIE